MELETVEVEQPTIGRGSRNRGEAAANQGWVLGPKDVLEGKLTIEGDLRIQGNATGEIRVGGDVHIDSGANVQALVEARNVSVRGNVSGNVTARKRLLLSGSGVVNGDVRVARLNVEDGATLNGNVSMGQVGQADSEPSGEG